MSTSKSAAAPASSALFITRLNGDTLEVLLRTAASKMELLPSRAIAATEHPAEAAWRVYAETLGEDDFRSFRKLGVYADNGNGAEPTWHLFQTAPDHEDQAAPAGLTWTSLALAASLAHESPVLSFGLDLLAR